MKLVAALWDADQRALLGAPLRSALAAAGGTRLQLNLDDEHVPASALRLQHFAAPLTAVVWVWTDGAAAEVVEALRGHAGHLAAWAVEEREPLPPPQAPDGRRQDALAQVAFLRRPTELPYADWLAHWHGPHTQVAIGTQATFGYVQNRVRATLTTDTPAVDAVVEELFPTAAVDDIHAFYGSDGDQAELERRLTRLMGSVATMGADRDLDVVPTGRWTWDLRAGATE